MVFLKTFKIIEVEKLRNYFCVTMSVTIGKQKGTPPAGFEPATFGLEVRRAIRCAMEAINYHDPGGTRTHNR